MFERRTTKRRYDDMAAGGKDVKHADSSQSGVEAPEVDYGIGPHAKACD